MSSSLSATVRSLPADRDHRHDPHRPWSSSPRRRLPRMAGQLPLAVIGHDVDG
jgi:hypothetical protein